MNFRQSRVGLHWRRGNLRGPLSSSLPAIWSTEPEQLPVPLEPTDFENDE